MKIFIGWFVSWSLFRVGQFCSLMNSLPPLDWIFGAPYQWSMGWSHQAQMWMEDYDGVYGPWEPSRIEIDNEETVGPFHNVDDLIKSLEEE